MISSTVNRVPENTSPEINEEIRSQIEKSIERFAQASPAQIEERLRVLDREWDTERLLETNASSLILLGIALGAFVHPLWLILPALIAGFLLQHAVQGWCPPLPILRRLGFRTATEIDYERYALKIVRGDFRNLPSFIDAEEQFVTSRFEDEGGPAVDGGPVLDLRRGDSTTPAHEILEAVRH